MPSLTFGSYPWASRASTPSAPFPAGFSKVQGFWLRGPERRRPRPAKTWYPEGALPGQGVVGPKGKQYGGIGQIQSYGRAPLLLFSAFAGRAGHPLVRRRNEGPGPLAGPCA